MRLLPFVPRVLAVSFPSFLHFPNFSVNLLQLPFCESEKKGLVGLSVESGLSFLTLLD